ncbi:MAG: hypothetical protein HYU59_07575 [Magnetospirillum gryphiswaldense]|nr:hypothetical protein [Magnetospirillum gryphiswaldense]
MKRFLTSVAIVALMTSAPALAHSDRKLEQALAGADGVALKQYRQVSLYSQLANVYAWIGDHDKARDLLQSASQASAGLGGYLRDDSLAALANEQASTGDFAGALARMAEIDDTDARVKLGLKLVSKLAKADRKAEAQALLDDIRAQVETVTEQHRRIELLTGTGAAYKALAPEQGRPLVTEALRLARATAMDDHDRVVLFNEIGANLIDVGLRDQAIALFAEAGKLGATLGNPLERAQSFAMLGGERAEKGERDAAAEALEEGVKAALKVASAVNRDAVLSELARNFGQSRRFERGLEVAGLIADPAHRAEGHIRIAKNMARSNREAEARTLLGRTEILAGTIDAAHDRAVILRKLAAEWAGLKDNTKARTLLDRALTENAG